MCMSILHSGMNKQICKIFTNMCKIRQRLMHLKESNSRAGYLGVVNCHTFNGFD